MNDRFDLLDVSRYIINYLQKKKKELNSDRLGLKEFMVLCLEHRLFLFLHFSIDIPTNKKLFGFQRK